MGHDPNPTTTKSKKNRSLGIKSVTQALHPAPRHEDEQNVKQQIAERAQDDQQLIAMTL
jgi:hypothetical protein